MVNYKNWMYMRIFCVFCLLIFTPFFASSQEQDGRPFRGSIPEELLRPGRGEAPRYPIDIVIGELGRGSASNDAFLFANTIGAGLISGQMEHPALVSVNSVIRESYLSSLAVIDPEVFRIGGGREEIDGAFSFLIRFLGKEKGITGELYIRYKIDRNSEGSSAESNWVLEELLLEEAKDREVVFQEVMNRNDYIPYERFF